MKFYSHRVIGNIMIIINKQEEPGSVKLGAEGNMRSSCSSIGSSIVGSSIGSSIGLFNGRSEKSVNLSGFSTCFCHFFAFSPSLCIYKTNFEKKSALACFFWPGWRPKHFASAQGGLPPPTQLTNTNIKIMKIRVS